MPDQQVAIRNSKGEVAYIPLSRAQELGIAPKSETVTTSTSTQETPWYERAVDTIKGFLPLSQNLQFNKDFKAGKIDEKANHPMANLGTNTGQAIGNMAGDMASSAIPGGSIARLGMKALIPPVASFIGGKGGQYLSQMAGGEENLDNASQVISSILPSIIGAAPHLDRVVQAGQDLKRAANKPSDIGKFPSEVLKGLADWYYGGGDRPGKPRTRFQNPVMEPPIKEVGPTGTVNAGSQFLTETEILEDWKKNRYPALTSQTTGSQMAAQQESANPRLRSEIIPRQDEYHRVQAEKQLKRGIMFNKERAEMNRATLQEALDNPAIWSASLGKDKKKAADLLTSELFERMYENDKNIFDTGKGRAFIREYQEKFARSLTSEQRHGINKFIASVEQQERRGSALNFIPAMQVKGEKSAIVALPSFAATPGSAVSARAASALGFLKFEKDALSKLVTQPEFSYAAARLMDLPGGSSGTRSALRKIISIAGREGVRFTLNVDGNETEVVKNKDGKWVTSDGGELDLGPDIFGKE